MRASIEAQGHMGNYVRAHSFIGDQGETYSLMSLKGHGLGLMINGTRWKVHTLKDLYGKVHLSGSQDPIQKK